MRTIGLGSIGILLLGSVASADRLELRDGRSLEGRFRGADEHSIQLESREEIHLIPIAQVHRVTFGDAPAAAPTPTQPPATAAEAQPRSGVAPAPHAFLEASTEASPAAAPTAPSTATAAQAAPAAPPTPRSVEIPLGTRLRVKIGDTVDPRVGAAGDRFAGLLETGLVAGDTTLIPARTRVYGVVSEARIQGPVASRLKLELTQLMIGGEMLPVVSGTHTVVALPGTQPGPAKAVPARPDRIPAGSVLEFRLLQSVVVPRPRP